MINWRTFIGTLASGLLVYARTALLGAAQAGGEAAARIKMPGSTLLATPMYVYGGLAGAMVTDARVIEALPVTGSIAYRDAKSNVGLAPIIVVAMLLLR